MNESSRRVVLGLILLVATVLRFSGLDWGIRSLETFRLDGQVVSVNEAGFGADADALYRAAESLSDRYYPTAEYAGQTYLFNSYGNLFPYLNWIFAGVGGVVAGFEPFGETARDENLTRMSGRWVSAVAGVLTVWVTWLIGMRLLGPVAAAGTGMVAAVLPMAVQAGHLATVDGLLGLWFGCVLWASVRVYADGGRRLYLLAGLFIGLATATKINGLFLLLPLGLAHLLRHTARADGSLLTAVRDRTVYLAGAAAVGVWVVLTPAAVFDFGQYFSPDFAGPYHVQFSLRKAAETASEHRGWLHLADASTYGYHPVHVFPLGMGWVVQAALVAGLVVSAIRKRPDVGIVAISFVVYYLLVARLPDKPIRFFVPLVPYISVLTCFAVTALAGRRSRVAIGVLAVLLIEPALRTGALLAAYHQPDARVAAAQWIQTQIDVGGKLMLERGHNSLAPLISRRHVSLLLADLEHELGNARNARLASEGHYSAILEAEFLSQVDYFAMSEERLALKKVRPSAVDFYDRLFRGELGFALRETFTGRPSFLGMRFEGPLTDLNWSRYDHPTTYVFERVTEEPPLYSLHPDLAVYRLRTHKDTETVILRAQVEKDFALFKRCLPATFKEQEGEKGLAKRFLAFLRDPMTLTGPDGRLTALKEGQVWRIKP